MPIATLKRKESSTMKIYLPVAEGIMALFDRRQTIISQRAFKNMGKAQAYVPEFAQEVSTPQDDVDIHSLGPQLSVKLHILEVVE